MVVKATVSQHRIAFPLVVEIREKKVKFHFQPLPQQLLITSSSNTTQWITAKRDWRIIETSSLTSKLFQMVLRTLLLCSISGYKAVLFPAIAHGNCCHPEKLANYFLLRHQLYHNEELSPKVVDTSLLDFFILSLHCFSPFLFFTNLT